MVGNSCGRWVSPSRRTRRNVSDAEFGRRPIGRRPKLVYTRFGPDGQLEAIRWRRPLLSRSETGAFPCVNAGVLLEPGHIRASEFCRAGGDCAERRHCFLCGRLRYRSYGRKIRPRLQYQFSARVANRRPTGPVSSPSLVVGDGRVMWAAARASPLGGRGGIEFVIFTGAIPFRIPRGPWRYHGSVTIDYRPLLREFTAMLLL